MKKQSDKPSRSRRIGAAARTARNSGPEREKTRTVQEGPATNFPVVAIGASAGGLDALKRFFAAMPAEPGLSFVVIVHLDPTHVSHLPELLGRCTTMPVTQVQEGETVQPNHVHVIPPDKCLTLSRGILHLGDRVERPGIPMPINRFFGSLAEDQEERGIGILLSGSGSDGTLGLREIKAAGGLVLVQTPETAEHKGMPQSAIATGLVDCILRVEALPEVLLLYVAHAQLGSPLMSLPADTDKDPFYAILALLHARGRLDFRCYKPGMLLRRIRRRMGLTQRGQMADYLQLLREMPPEVDALIRDLLIGITSFFRDPEAWQALEAEVIPRLLAAKPGEASLRVWVPGCATGEEAYSIGMLLLEQVQNINHGSKIQIFATDIDRKALEVGRAGLYPESSAASVPPERLQRFFTRTSKGYQITKPLRETVVFASQNLITDPSFSRLDLISCRNLLIYLQPELQQKLLGLFHFVLNEGGYLFLGKSETTTQRPGLFQPVSKQWHLYQGFAAVRPVRPELPLMPEYAPDSHPLGPDQRPRGSQGYGERVQRVLLQRYAPAAVLVNRDYRTLYSHGQTDDYLVHPSGNPTDDLLAMAREGLRLKLRAVLHQAMSETKAATAVAEVKGREASRRVQVTVTPLEGPPQELWLVTFAAVPEPHPAAGSTPPVIEGDTVVRHLEDELVSVKKELQSTIEELEASNQELKVSNEETLSMNEELQSTNEELETSKEELQSLNEELATVNLQLEDKVVELERANNDLSNLLSSTHIATLFLDRSFCIRRFTPACTRLFNLIPTDVGRPITDIAGPYADAELFQNSRQVLESLTPVEKEVGTASGEWYLRRVLPYRTQEDQIEGVVVTYTDVTTLKRAADDTRRLANTVMDSNDAITVFDFEGRILAWNRGGEALYGYSEAEALTLKIDALVPEGARPAHRELMARLQRGEGGQSYETQRLTQDGQVVDIWLTASALHDAAGQPTAIATTARDITERKRAEQALRESEARLRAIVDTIPDVLLVLDEEGRYLEILTAQPTLLHTDPAALKGKLISDVLPAEVAQVALQAIRQTLLTRRPQRFEYALSIETAGQSYFEARTAPLNGLLSRPAVVLLARDVTQQRLTEESLRQAQKMEAVGQLTGGMAHDFNNLLAVILGNLELLAEALDDSALADLVQRALEATERGADLIRRLLAFARKQPLQSKPVDLNRLMTGMLELLQRTLGETIQVEIALAEDLDQTVIDPGQFETALLNLAVNARDAMPNGGRLTIETANRWLAEDDVHTQIYEVGPGPYVMLAVSDTGSGMPPAVVEHAFEPFFTTKEVGQGSGLGLSMVYGLIKQSGGYLQLYSELHRGTTLRMYLPAVPPASDATPVAPPSEALLPTGQGQLILVVEDEALVRCLVVRMLQSLGYQTVEAETAATALEVLAANPQVAMLLTDVVLPGGKSGVDLAQEAHRRRPDLKVLFTSGYTEAHLTPFSRHLETSELLSKPYRKAQLADKLHTLLGHAPSSGD